MVPFICCCICIDKIGGRGGVKRSFLNSRGEDPAPSEAACPPGEPLGKALFHQMWRLALPPGATMDHPFANPFAPDAVPFDRLGGGDGGTFPPVLVVDPDQDVLHDRVVKTSPG